MSYTATTIGFGEIPYPFTAAQRLWVTALDLPDRRSAGRTRSARCSPCCRTARSGRRWRCSTSPARSRRLREPFLLIAGYGQTGELLGRSLDALGRRFVVLDSDSERIDALDLDSYHADVPGLVADARNPRPPGRGRARPPATARGCSRSPTTTRSTWRSTMSAALLRPDLPVIARTVSPAIGRPDGGVRRARPWSTRSTGSATTCGSRCARPASYQLLTWLESGPGAALPAARHAAAGRPLGGLRLRPVRPGAHRATCAPRGSR